MQPLFLVSLLLALTLAQQYVPGTPGAPWSEEEMIIVKAKLYSVFNRGGGGRALKQIYGVKLGWNWTDIPNAAKMLRLIFHDCLKYSDGTGGCDGCLNWEGVGFRHKDATDNFKFPNVGKTNNNGLKWTVEVLEAIYTNATFPINLAPALSISLKDSGKSRADLWAFASIVAVEYGVETNNKVCEGNLNNNPTSVQCNEDLGEPNCKVNLPKNFKFLTGRKDCTEIGDQPYKSTKEESHPNAVGNGKMTIDFFKNDFGLTGRETITLLGAHTMGRLHQETSLFKYVWTSSGTHMFNNHYYRNIVRADRYFFNDNSCTKVTDAENNKPKTRWVAHVRKDTFNGGPVHWIHENYVCPNCVKSPDNGCCKNVPEGQFCKADTINIEEDPNINGGCESYKFVSGLDEMALPSEIGLYFDFEVTDDGIPYGCPGFEVFDSVHFNMSYLHMWTTLPKSPGSAQRIKADPQCELNKIQEPTGSTPLHAVFEEYAADQDVWIEQYIPAHEKMISNGYSVDDLTDANYDNFDIACPRDYGKVSFTNCYHISNSNENPAFIVFSQLDNRTLEGQTNGGAKMKTYDPNNDNQKWRITDMGHQWINIGTNQPLKINTGRNWKIDGKFIRDARENSRVLDRGWNQVEGQGLTTWTAHGAVNQRFDIHYLPSPTTTTQPPTTTTTTTTQPLGCGFPYWKGDNWCDDENNNEGCDWDGGDCCGDQVKTYYCTACLCLDPNFETK